MRRILLTVIASLTTLVAALPALASVTGPDVSNWQHPNGVSIGWGSVATSGQAFAFVKATEGTNYTNPYYSKDTAQAAQAGLMHGAYDFAHPNDSAVAEAQYFASVIGAQNQPGDLPPVLDLEQTGGLSASQLITWVGTWLTEVQTLTHREPMIYVSPYFWIDNLNNTHDYANYPLWVAQYCGSCTSPMAFGGWNGSWTFWQYTDNASIPGISGAVDESYFIGSLAVLKANYAEENLKPSTVTPTLTAAPSAGPPYYVGRTISVAGTVSPSQGGDIVTVQADLSGSWHNVGWATASPGANNTGHYAASVYLGAVGTFPFRVLVSANVVHAAGMTAPFNLVVTQPPPAIVTVALNPAVVIAGNHVTVSGTVSPGSAGNPVDVQIQMYGSWHTVATPTTNSSGGYSASVLAGLEGQFPVRAVAPATYNYSSGVSPTVTLTDNPPPPSTVTVALNPAVTIAGSHVTVSGTVTPGSAGNPVDVQIDMYGTWHTVATPTTDSSGAYSASILAGLVGQFQVRAVAPATLSYAGSVSPTVTLTDNPPPPASVTVTVNPDATVAGNHVTVSGTVTPASAGDTVDVQIDMYGSWHTVATPTTDSSGAYSASILAGLQGQFPVRAVAPATSSYSTGTSPTVTLTDNPPPTNAAVTVTVTPAVTTAGQHVTVSGTVTPASAGNQVIVEIYLYGSWHPVATPTTDSSGAYSASVYAGLQGQFQVRALAPETPTYNAMTSPVTTLTDNPVTGTTVSAALSPTTTTAGQHVTVSGTVGPNGGGASVIAQALLYGSWHNVGSATADSAGAYSASIYAGLPGTFKIRVLAPATALRAAVVSPTETLQVNEAPAPKVTAFPSSYSVRVGTHLLVRGGVSGSHGGDRIVVEAYYGSVWHNVAAVWDNGNGYFGAWVYCGLRGSFPFRVLALANAAHPLGISSKFTERVY